LMWLYLVDEDILEVVYLTRHILSTLFYVPDPIDGTVNDAIQLRISMTFIHFADK
jgi:hypothetical protein